MGRYAGANWGAMGRIVLIVVLVLLVLSGIGVLVLGAFPPEAKVQQIQKVLPNERFQRSN
jgi:hypothetical protein